MPECFGGWVGEGSGSWTGTFDDSNMIALQRETNGYAYQTKLDVDDIKTQAFGSYGFQASWDLLHGVQLNWDAWLGVSHTGDTYTWYETARQVDGTNEIVAANRVDIGQILIQLRAMQLRIEQLQTTCTGIANTVQSVLTQVAVVRDALYAFRDAVYARFYRLITAVVAVLEAYLLPLYRLCKADGSAAGDIGSVDVTTELDVTNGLTPGVGDAVVSSASSTGGIHINCHKLADYGLFYPLIGSNEMYYSQELRQVIARPYRNSGHVYLS